MDVGIAKIVDERFLSLRIEYGKANIFMFTNRMKCAFCRFLCIEIIFLHTEIKAAKVNIYMNCRNGVG
jgi:hypothetical protein